MSAGSQIQMAPQSTVNSGQSVHSQDSNMSTGKLCLHTVVFSCRTFVMGKRSKKINFVCSSFQGHPTVIKSLMVTLLKNIKLELHLIAKEREKQMTLVVQVLLVGRQVDQVALLCSPKGAVVLFLRQRRLMNTL